MERVAPRLEGNGVSNQGEDGWFPECLVCRMGNIGPAVCLDPTCHEAHEGEAIDGAIEKFVKTGGHAWQLCQFCDRRILSDGGSFGVYALCVECWNAYAAAGRLPPIDPSDLHNDLATGILCKQNGAAVVKTKAR